MTRTEWQRKRDLAGMTRLTVGIVFGCILAATMVRCDPLPTGGHFKVQDVRGAARFQAVKWLNGGAE